MVARGANGRLLLGTMGGDVEGNEGNGAAARRCKGVTGWNPLEENRFSPGPFHPIGRGRPSWEQRDTGPFALLLNRRQMVIHDLVFDGVGGHAELIGQVLDVVGGE